MDTETRNLLQALMAKLGGNNEPMTREPNRKENRKGNPKDGDVTIRRIPVAEYVKQYGKNPVGRPSKDGMVNMTTANSPAVAKPDSKGGDKMSKKANTPVATNDNLVVTVAGKVIYSGSYTATESKGGTPKLTFGTAMPGSKSPFGTVYMGK